MGLAAGLRHGMDSCSPTRRQGAGICEAEGVAFRRGGYYRQPGATVFFAPVFGKKTVAGAQMPLKNGIIGGVPLKLLRLYLFFCRTEKVFKYFGLFCRLKI